MVVLHDSVLLKHFNLPQKLVCDQLAEVSEWQVDSLLNLPSDDWSTDCFLGHIFFVPVVVLDAPLRAIAKAMFLEWSLVCCELHLVGGPCIRVASTEK